MSSVSKNGKAFVQGVQEGDLLRSINGRSVSSLGHEEALDLLRSSSDQLVLELKRGNESYKSETNANVSFEQNHFEHKKDYSGSSSGSGGSIDSLNLGSHSASSSTQSDGEQSSSTSDSQGSIIQVVNGRKLQFRSPSPCQSPLPVAARSSSVPLVWSPSGTSRMKSCRAYQQVAFDIPQTTSKTDESRAGLSEKESTDRPNKEEGSTQKPPSKIGLIGRTASNDNSHQSAVNGWGDKDNCQDNGSCYSNRSNDNTKRNDAVAKFRHSSKQPEDASNFASSECFRQPLCKLKSEFQSKDLIETAEVKGPCLAQRQRDQKTRFRVGGNNPRGDCSYCSESEATSEKRLVKDPWRVKDVVKSSNFTLTSYDIRRSRGGVDVPEMLSKQSREQGRVVMSPADVERSTPRRNGATPAETVQSVPQDVKSISCRPLRSQSLESGQIFNLGGLATVNSGLDPKSHGQQQSNAAFISRFSLSRTPSPAGSILSDCSDNISIDSNDDNKHWSSVNNANGTKSNGTPLAAPSFSRNILCKPANSLPTQPTDNTLCRLSDHSPVNSNTTDTIFSISSPTLKKTDVASTDDNKANKRFTAGLEKVQFDGSISKPTAFKSTSSIHLKPSKIDSNPTPMNVGQKFESIFAAGPFSNPRDTATEFPKCDSSDAKNRDVTESRTCELQPSESVTCPTERRYLNGTSTDEASRRSNTPSKKIFNDPEANGLKFSGFNGKQQGKPFAKTTTRVLVSNQDANGKGSDQFRQAAKMPPVMEGIASASPFSKKQSPYFMNELHSPVSDARGGGGGGGERGKDGLLSKAENALQSVNSVENFSTNFQIPATSVRAESFPHDSLGGRRFGGSGNGVDTVDSNCDGNLFLSDETWTTLRSQSTVNGRNSVDSLRPSVSKTDSNLSLATDQDLKTRSKVPDHFADVLPETKFLGKFHDISDAFDTMQNDFTSENKIDDKQVNRVRFQANFISTPPVRPVSSEKSPTESKAILNLPSVKENAVDSLKESWICHSDTEALVEPAISRTRDAHTVEHSNRFPFALGSSVRIKEFRPINFRPTIATNFATSGESGNVKSCRSASLSSDSNCPNRYAGDTDSNTCAPGKSLFQKTQSVDRFSSVPPDSYRVFNTLDPTLPVIDITPPARPSETPSGVALESRSPSSGKGNSDPVTNTIRRRELWLFRKDSDASHSTNFPPELENSPKSKSECSKDGPHSNERTDQSIERNSREKLAEYAASCDSRNRKHFPEKRLQEGLTFVESGSAFVEGTDGYGRISEPSFEHICLPDEITVDQEILRQPDAEIEGNAEPKLVSGLISISEAKTLLPADRSKPNFTIGYPLPAHHHNVSQSLCTPANSEILYRKQQFASKNDNNTKIFEGLPTATSRADSGYLGLSRVSKTDRFQGVNKTETGVPVTRSGDSQTSETSESDFNLIGLPTEFRPGKTETENDIPTDSAASQNIYNRSGLSEAAFADYSRQRKASQQKRAREATRRPIVLRGEEKRTPRRPIVRYTDIGPKDDETGMPTSLRSWVDEGSQREWYKQMYNALHKKTDGYNRPGSAMTVGSLEDYSDKDDHSSVYMESDTEADLRRIRGRRDRQPSPAQSDHSVEYRRHRQFGAGTYNERQNNETTSVGQGRFKLPSLSYNSYSASSCKPAQRKNWECKPVKHAGDILVTNGFENNNRPKICDSKTPSVASDCAESFNRKMATRSFKTVEEVSAKAKAAYSFRERSERELSFRKGDTIQLTARIDSNWYHGLLNGRKGLVPANYVEILDSSDEAETTALDREGEAVAKFTFRGQTERELSFRKEDVVKLIRRIDSGWYKGRLGFRQGIFPAAYVDIVREPKTPDSTAPSSAATSPRTGSPQFLDYCNSSSSSVSCGGHPSLPSSPTSSFVFDSKDFDFVVKSPNAADTDKSEHHSMVQDSCKNNKNSRNNRNNRNNSPGPCKDVVVLPSSLQNRPGAGSSSSSLDFETVAGNKGNMGADSAARGETGALPGSSKTGNDRRSATGTGNGMTTGSAEDDFARINGDIEMYNTLTDRFLRQIRRTDAEKNTTSGLRPKDRLASGSCPDDIRDLLKNLGDDSSSADVTVQYPAYRAVYDYKSQNDDELDLLEGDVVFVMEKCEDGWFVGTSQRTDEFGTFPGNYVEEMSPGRTG